MKHRNLLALSLCALFTTSAFAIEPPNLGLLRNDLVQYHDSGKYNNQISTVYQRAENYLATRIHENDQSAHPKKLAVVFDIDETALSNYTDLHALNFGGTSQSIDDALQKAKDPAISPALDLYHEAMQNHVAVFFVTGRKPYLQNATIKNLTSAGYKSWTGLYLKPMSYNLPSVAPYKSGARKQIESEGYDIVLNIGDQKSDLAGGYADKSFKLPNPYYYIL